MTWATTPEKMQWLKKLISKTNRDDKDYDLPAVFQESDTEIQGQFTEQRLQAAIQELPLHFRTVVIMRDIQELSYEEISRIVDVPLGTVKSRINRARLQLQKALKEYR